MAEPQRGNGSVVISFYGTPDGYSMGTSGTAYSYDDYGGYCWSERPRAADRTRLYCFMLAGHEAEGVRCGAPPHSHGLN
ncbi:hypothetical protein ACW9HR_22375 [Nocardia gipuzkoensis]